MAGEAKRSKAPNWTDEETLQLVHEVDLRKNIIQKKFSNDVTVQTKRKAWEEITLLLNSRFPHHHRSSKEVKKRWDNVSTRMRRQYSEIQRNMQKTGKHPYVRRQNLPNFCFSSSLVGANGTLCFTSYLLFRLGLLLLYSNYC